MAPKRLTHAIQRVPSRRASLAMRAALAPGESTSWLTDRYTSCKSHWRYRIPKDKASKGWPSE
ncbi:MAG TPA: hypothetical protein VF808_11395 [Ktedonobacterales bacterium]